MGRRPKSPTTAQRIFVKALFSGFMKKLLIPKNYVMLHRDTLGRECVLWPTHTHDSWRVRTRRIDDELYFNKGWNAFAKHHSLQFGDLLIFRHVQNSEFHVDVVDKSGIPRKTLASENDRLMKDSAPVPTSRRRRKAILQTPPLTAAEALISSSEYPSFKKIMKSAYVKSGGYMVSHHAPGMHHVPLDYSKEHMKDYSGYVKIKLSESNAWTVKVLRRSCESRTLLSSGWGDLARENSLRVDDVCVFQLINTKDYTLQLTIFRHTSGENQRLKQCQVKLKSRSSYSELTAKSKELSEKAFEEAERFQSMSKYPSIVIVMQPAYVKHGFLHVPFAFHNEMCKKEGENEVKFQSLGEEREVIMNYVRKQCRISKGWGAFVKENCIEVDDVCVLELISKEDGVIRISIFK